VATATETSSSAVETKPANTPLTGEQMIANARKTVETDLKNWQDKFATAADKGADDLEEQTKDIAEKYVKKSVDGEGADLVSQLEKVSAQEIETLKTRIISIVESLPDDATIEDEENAEDELVGAVRSAGMAIRQSAQALRSWRNSFESKLMDQVTKAVDSTIDVLDGIESLGLQEIGMRWAWMDGVTYKDWAKYHALKKTFKEWRDEVGDVAYQHPSLTTAREAAEDAESNGMSVAEGAAKELTRLKDVGRWKIRAKDSTDDFKTRVIPPSTAKAAKKVEEQVESEKIADVSPSIVGTSQGTVESVASEVPQSASAAASAVSSVVVGEELSGFEGAASSVSSAVSSVASAASSQADVASEKASGVFSDGTSIISETFTVVENAASEAVVGSETPLAQSILADAARKVDDGTSSAADFADDVASSASSSATSVASEASSKAWGGAMAQEVKGSQPILDDVIDESESFSEKLQSVMSKAGDRYADATKAVSEALLGATKTQGTVESVTSVAEELYSSAIEAASSILYGTTQGTGESMMSVASSQFDAAVAA
jgi:hypothetical protein